MTEHEKVDAAVKRLARIYANEDWRTVYQETSGDGPNREQRVGWDETLVARAFVESRKKRSPRLTMGQRADFAHVVRVVNAVDAALTLLNDLCVSVGEEDLRRFVGILSDALDPDTRCPK
jgi:hypothetical protein